MMYKVPMPTRTNGVRLFRLPNEQIGIEYQRGEPHVGGMAYDSALGSMARDIAIRRPRPDLDRIVSDAVRRVDAEDAMPRAGIQRSRDMKPGTTMEYDDDASKVISTLLDYLEKYLDPEQMESVNLILSSGDAPDNDAGEPHNYQATDRRRAARQAADAARRRPLSAAAEDAYLRLFPNANRLA